MKSNFFNKAKLSCKTIAMILVAAIVIVSVDGCGKSETGVSSGTGAGVKTIQVDTAVDRIPAEPIEEAALALQTAYEKLEASTGDDAAFADALQGFRETLVKYQSVYNGTEGEKDKDYQGRIETVLHQAKELENVNLNDREQKMDLLRQYMEEPDSVHTYGDQLIEGDEPDVETRKVESFEAAREKMENAAEEEVDGTPKGKQKTAGGKNLLTEGPTALSDVMKAKADELKTPLAIYNELKNTLQYENYFGSRKGAIAAYDALSGNDVDQASVLIAMLRYLGYEAVYAEGDILLDPDQAMALTGAGNVTAAANALALGGKKSTLLVAGGKPAGVSIRHTWVRTLVPYGDYRGAGKNSGKKRWIDLDVSFKQYEDTGKNIYDDGEGLGIDGQAILEQYKQGKTDMLDSLLASGEVSEKAEGMYGVRKKIREQTVAYLPLSLPYPAEDVDCYEMIDDGQSDRLCITVGNAPLGTYTSSELYGKRVVLEYRPATEADGERIRQVGGIFRAAADQVQMVPVLKIDGQVMAEGEAVYLGSSENMRMDVFSGNTSYSSDNRVTAGSVYQFSLDTQSITPAELEKARLDAEAVKDRVDTDTVYSDEYLGALLKYAGTMYFAQIDVVNRLLAEADEIVSVRNLSVGITEYEVQSIRALGRVVGIQEGSLCIDVDMDVHSRTSLRLDDEACVAYSFAYGMAASRFEDVIWNEFTGQDCISTMSIFERAKKEGIDLVTLNGKSYNENITRFSADKDTLSAVRSAVNRGLTVIIPERGMEWDDWEGTGYLILNPETGAGEYMISGGLSGGSTSTAVTIAGICAIIAQIAMMALFTIMVGSMLSAIFAAALIMQLFYIVCMFMTMLSMVFMSERTTAMILSLKQYASGNTSREEYILKEFRQTAVELALLVVCMSVDRYILDSRNT